MIEETKKDKANELLQLAINKLEDVRNLLEKIYLKGDSNCKEFDWIDNKQLEKLLGIHERTLQAWRDNGSLNFSKIGKKIFYNKRDIEQLLWKKFNRVVEVN
jgi:hypothetical protein